MSDPNNVIDPRGQSHDVTRASTDEIGRSIPGPAEASIRAAIAQLEALLPERALTLRALWDRYVSSLPCEPWVGSVRSVMLPLMAMFGDVQVSALSASHWADYRDCNETRERYMVSSRNAQLWRLKACLNWAVATDRIAFNALAKAKPEKSAPERETVISAAGETAVLAELDPLMRAFFLLALDGAMRRDEIRLLEWTDVDMATRTVTLPAHRTKTRTSRTVQLTTRAIEALSELPRCCDHIFANPKTCKPYTETAIWKRWNHARIAADLKPASGESAVRVHDARRSAATRLTSLGAKITAIQKILGHKHLSTTALYIRVESADVIDAYRLLETSTRKPAQRAPTKACVSHDLQKATGA